MSRFPKLGTSLSPDFRNSYNEGTDLIDQELNSQTQKLEDQKTRVDNLITSTPQPSEVVDARGAYTVLGDRLNDTSDKIGLLNTQLTDNAINVKTFGAKGDGISDDTLAIQEAINAAPVNGKIIFPQGKTYRGTIVINKPIQIDFMNSKIIPPSGTDLIIKAEGTKDSTNYILANSVVRGDRKLIFTTEPANLSDGDLIVLRDDTVRETDNKLDVNIELHEIKAVDTVNKTVTLKDFVRLPKGVSVTSNVYKITPIKGITINNLNLEAINGATHNHGIFIDMCRDVNINNVSMQNNVGPCITLSRSYNCKLDGFKITGAQSTGSGQGYGVMIGSGTNNASILNGYGDGLRHTVDCANAFDVYVKNVASLNCAHSHFVISHNGWDSDITFESCKVFGINVTAGYGFNLSSQGTGNPYQLSNYGIRLIDCDIYLDEYSNATGIYLDQPVKESKINGVRIIIGKGEAPNTAVSTIGIRLHPVDNDITIDGAEIRGARFAYYFSNSINKLQANPKDSITILNTVIDNAEYGFYTQYLRSLHIKGANISNVLTHILRFSQTTSTEMLRYFTFKDIVINGYVAGSLISWNETKPSTGILGEISNIQVDSVSSNTLTIMEGLRITKEDMLIRNGIIRAVATTAASLATTPFEVGIVEGQRMKILCPGQNVTIPYMGSRNLNNGGTSLVLSSNNRAVEYVWSGGLWYEV